MRTLATAALLSCIAATAALAAGETMKTAPPDSWTVTNYYKQSVYDPQLNKIGTIDDVLLDKQGKVTGLIIGVGGFLGIGQKDVAVPFAAVKTEKKNDKQYLTLDETKDSLKAATGYKYDRTATTWVVDNGDRGKRTTGVASDRSDRNKK
jgi:sporulation protein YlmC with PRC-barrel domain